MQTELVASAAQWLRYKRQCFLIATERGLYPWGRPDVFGVTLQRRTIEVEVKVTLADFRANAKKRISGLPRAHWHPWQFYFIVPPALVESVALELPEWSGLLTLDTYRDYLPCRVVKVVKRSPCNDLSPQVKVRDLAEMAKHMSGTITRCLAGGVRDEQQLSF